MMATIFTNNIWFTVINVSFDESWKILGGGLITYNNYVIVLESIFIDDLMVM